MKSVKKKTNGKIQIFIKSTKTKSPTGDSGATSLPPIRNSFMYIEASSNNHGNNVFVSSERTDIVQITNITIYYNRVSNSINDSLKSMGRFEFNYFYLITLEIQILLLRKILILVIRQQNGIY